MNIFSRVISQTNKSYIKSLEKQLLFYKRAEEQGKLLLLPAAVGDRYYTSNNIELTFTSVAEVVELMPEIGKTIFLTKIHKPAVAVKYVSRSLLEDTKRAQLQQNDRDYYQEHKEEVNKKDRDKYHILHPNARYYKKRKKSDEPRDEE